LYSFDISYILFFDSPSTFLFLIKSPWKLVQLNYLAALQSADLKRRSRKSNQDEGKETNNKNNNKDDYNIAMFVARRVVPVKSSSPQIAQSTPLILDLESIYPHPPPVSSLIENSTPLEYVRGEILGFCEVMERPYGLGHQHDDVTVPRGKKLSRINSITGISNPIRPFLTNLCVRGNARAVGIGGTLVEACEYAVAGWQDDDGRQRREIVLEVEQDNPAALQFYQKRGYDIVFSDPACRRFTTHGLWLTKERCTKVCMRKVIGVAQTSIKPSSDKSSKGNLSKLFQTFYDIVP
jgi:GNAT superfamily N-acetyltransferase